MTVVGFQELTGTGSITGKPYKLLFIYYLQRDSKTTGFIADCQSVDLSRVQVPAISLGDEITFHYAKDGYVDSVEVRSFPSV